ncbi:LysR family transcriptional regulator [Erysipelothrix aquatica]|uniref:LysR family transcriptional regulator n=1 Tax=Erysipelothrix aquatica TaxID=2683714 RepID=UPI00135B5040|nr:LysR family transcriptional regulator [Erysipelothrix aquatica]
MDLKKLGYFVTLVEEGNFSRAAKALYITQPALSWNVKELEEMLGTQLVKRSTTGIEITEAGNVLYTGAKTLLMDADNLMRSVRYAGQLQKRRIRFGLTILSSIEYMSIFQKFTEFYPDYRLDYTQRGSKEIQQLVANGQLDIGMVSTPIYFPILNESKVILDDYYYDVAVVLPKGHRLCQATSLSLEQLKNERFSMMTDAFAMGNEIEKRCIKIGYYPDIVFVNENWEVIVEHVATYKSVTFLPFAIQDVLQRDDIVWIPLEDAEVARFNVVLITSLDLKDYDNRIFYNSFQQTLLSTESTSK